MSDLVERLRAEAKRYYGTDWNDPPIEIIAADRIEELEAALRSLADDEWWDMETPTTAADFAAKALRGK